MPRGYRKATTRDRPGRPAEDETVTTRRALALGALVLSACAEAGVTLGGEQPATLAAAGRLLEAELCRTRPPDAREPETLLRCTLGSIVGRSGD